MAYNGEKPRDAQRTAIKTATDVELNSLKHVNDHSRGQNDSSVKCTAVKQAEKFGKAIPHDHSEHSLTNNSTRKSTEVQRTVKASTKLVTNGDQSINLATEKSPGDSGDRNSEEWHSDNDITPTNTPKLRKAPTSCDEIDDATPTNRPKLKAVKIKQEMFPKEEKQSSSVKYESDNSNSINQRNENRGKFVPRTKDSEVKFYIDDENQEEMDNAKLLRKSAVRKLSNNRRKGIYGMNSLQDDDDDDDNIGDLADRLLQQPTVTDGQRSRSLDADRELQQQDKVSANYFRRNSM